jgi:tetratricopeptide (TPR) repeat protein
MKFKSSFRILALILLTCIPILSFGYGQINTEFSNGNAFYAKGRYKDALGVYEKMTNEGYQSASLYFNMGNAYFKIGDIASAILYYEKAHKLSPADDDINFNLNFAKLRTSDKIEAAPEFFLNRWWKGAILSFPLHELALWSIIFVLTGSALLILYFFSASFSVKRTSFYAAVTLFVIGLLTVFIANRQVSYFDDHMQAIIFKGAVNVKNGPVDRSGTLFVIHNGTKVDILDNDNGWLKIRLANGNEGWIQQGDIKEI